MAIDFKPSDVFLASVPLVGTLGRAQLEHAAALIVRACQVNGDEWKPLAWPVIGAALKADVEAKREPVASLLRNPFFDPDIWGLVDRGFATWSEEPGGPISLTDPALDALRRWVVRAEVRAADSVAVDALIAGALIKEEPHEANDRQMDEAVAKSKARLQAIRDQDSAGALSDTDEIF